MQNGVTLYGTDLLAQRDLVPPAAWDAADTDLTACRIPGAMVAVCVWHCIEQRVRDGSCTALARQAVEGIVRGRGENKAVKPKFVAG